MMHSPTLRETALWFWERQLGKPYRWGGDDPVAGWDCSGLVIEGLKVVGILPRAGDWRAVQLADRFLKNKVGESQIQPGCLLFWNRGPNRVIGHVEIVWQVLNDRILTIGSSGGGSSTKTEADAIARNAYVKIRPAQPWELAVDPFG